MLDKPLRGPMRTTLLTIGYEKRSIEEYVQLLLDATVDVLLDVRETAWSHKPGFSKSALRDYLAGVGIEYVHAKFVGNPKSLRRQASSHRECLDLYSALVSQNREMLDRFEELVELFHAEGRRVCITCFERHPEDCHRGIIAAKWRKGGKRDIQHLAPEGCKRLVFA
jgi:uncharacterized protein (DUF488 family)